MCRNPVNVKQPALAFHHQSSIKSKDSNCEARQTEAEFIKYDFTHKHIYTFTNQMVPGKA